MSFKPPSLAQLFEPPDDHQALFGWVCGAGEVAAAR
jgi:hypothetical protein